MGIDGLGKNPPIDGMGTWGKSKNVQANFTLPTDKMQISEQLSAALRKKLPVSKNETKRVLEAMNQGNEEATGSTGVKKLDEATLRKREKLAEQIVNAQGSDLLRLLAEIDELT